MAKTADPTNTASWLTRLLCLAGVLLVLNSAYLAGFAASSFFYVGNSLIHPALGILTAILLTIYIIRHLTGFQRMTGAALILLALVATAAGGYLAIVGMNSRHRLALDVHVVFAIAVLIAVLVYLRKRRAPASSEPEKVQSASSGSRKAWLWSVGVALAAVALYGGGVLKRRFFPNSEYVIHNPKSPPLTMAQEGGGPHSLVWPSSAQIVNGKPLPESYFMNSKSCQPCHRDIYRQWKSSMHHYASFNDQWYKKSINYMQDVIGIKPSLWCGGCHDQALSLTGYMEKDPIRKIEDTPAGQAGLGCVSCHSMVHVGSTMGNGDYTFKYPQMAPYVASSNPLLRDIAYYEVLLNPKAHQATFFKPFIHNRAEEPVFCSVCHKVHLDVPVNHYRWLRAFDEYDNWQASGTDWLGARSFYYPPKPKTCIDCHMPLVRSNDFGNINGYVHSHNFAAANTAVPASYGNWKQVSKVEHFLKGSLSVDIFAIAKEPRANGLGPGMAKEPTMGGGPQLATTFSQGEESTTGGPQPGAEAVGKPVQLIAPLGRVNAAVYRGETIRVEVVVRTLTLGHFFPGGTVDAYDCWLELQARDDKGRIIFWSGEAADHGRGPVDPSAHFYRSVQLDAHGNVINKRNAWATRAVVYSRLIPPGAADTVHYRLKIPKDCGSKITLTAKLNYRKLDWWYTQWAFAGVHDPSQKNPGVSPDYDDTRWVFTGSTANVSAKYKQIPNVPTVVIAQQSVTIPVLGGGKSVPPFKQDVALYRADRSRWNDYGIGLLLQGDFKGSERAFEMVTRIDPNYADGWVNVARAMIQEGNTDAAKPLLEKALKLDPRLGSARYFYGLALKADGKYREAFDQFALAADRYPNDRVVRNQMGETLFLQRNYQAAVNEFKRTLTIDPEDLFAHYNLMLCYMGLDDRPLAEREKKFYLRFKAYEIALAITGPYKLAHPFDNNEAQPVHEHETVPLAEVGHPPASWYAPYPVQETHGAAPGRAASVAPRLPQE